MKGPEWSKELQKHMGAIAKPNTPVKKDEIQEAIKRGLGKKIPEYKGTFGREQVFIKSIGDDGKQMVLMNNTEWKAKEGRGLRPYHACGWGVNEPVCIKMWDQENDDYIIENLKAKNKSCWEYVRKIEEPR